MLAVELLGHAQGLGALAGEQEGELSWASRGLGGFDPQGQGSTRSKGLQLAEQLGAIHGDSAQAPTELTALLVGTGAEIRQRKPWISLQQCNHLLSLGLERLLTAG
jgi:hypothetical protein